MIQRLLKKHALKFTLLGIILLVLLNGAFLLFYTRNKAEEFKTTLNPEKAAELGKSLYEVVSQIYVLPQEDPTIATVTEPSNLPKDSFYEAAENGDKILIFPKTHLAVLYRPSIHKVVNVAVMEIPHNTIPQQNSPLPQAAATTVPRVIVTEVITPTITSSQPPVTPTPQN